MDVGGEKFRRKSREDRDFRSENRGNGSSGYQFKILSAEIRGNGDIEDVVEKLKGREEDDLVEGVSRVFSKGRKGGLKLGPNDVLEKGLNGRTIGPDRGLNGGQTRNILKENCLSANAQGKKPCNRINMVMGK